MVLGGLRSEEDNLGDIVKTNDVLYVTHLQMSECMYPSILGTLYYTGVNATHIPRIRQYLFTPQIELLNVMIYPRKSNIYMSEQRRHQRRYLCLNDTVTHPSHSEEPQEQVVNHHRGVISLWYIYIHVHYHISDLVIRGFDIGGASVEAK